MVIKFIQKLSSVYQFTALMFVNTLVALIVLNLIFYAAFAVKDYFFPLNPIWAKYGHSTVNSIYPGLSENEIHALLIETWSRPFLYEPFTQFQESPYQGYYVNVDVAGFRATKNQGAWPPLSDTVNIFLFGGSTMFGYGVSDDQTVASYLQTYLTEKLEREVRVYNFGRGDYYSTQERILYENILASGVTPDAALFMDGLNDFYYHSGEPRFTNEFREVMNQGNVNGIGFISKTSIGRVVRGFRIESEAMQPDFNKKYADLKVLDAVIQRYFQNKKLIEAASNSFGVVPIFVWQPIPTYHYDQQYHLFSEWGYGDHNYSKHGYERMAELLEEKPQDDNFLWLADIQQDKKEPLYIDLVHYSAHFSEQVAISIGDLLIERLRIPTH